jgi:hypothetical protein
VVFRLVSTVSHRREEKMKKPAALLAFLCTLVLGAPPTLVNEYYRKSSPQNWKTRIGAFKFPGCT